MDLNDDNKVASEVANRKKMISEMEQLRERENRNIIKIRVLRLRILSNMVLELQNLTHHLSILDTEKCAAEAAVSRTVNKVKALDSWVQLMTTARQDLERKLQVENKMEADIMEAMAKKIKQLTTALEDKERELSIKAGTISKLRGDVIHGLDGQTELYAKMQLVKRDMEGERQVMEERQTQLVAKIAQLEAVYKAKEDEMRTKDQELNKQITVIRELRGFKERLNQKIVAMAMQSRIDNINKEVVGPESRGSRPLTAADRDDNATMLTPHQSKPVEMNRRFETITPDEHLSL